MRALVARIDDLINPIVVKELRQAVQGRFVSVVFLLFLAVQLVVMGLYLFTSGVADQSQTLDYEAGRLAFSWLNAFLLGITVLFVPIYTGVRLAAERSDVNVDLLFVTTLRPRAIVTGKLAAAVVITLMIFSACAPFMTFTYLLRGIDLATIFLFIGLNFFVVIACVQLFIFLAVVSTSRVLKVIVGVLGLFVLLWGGIGTMGISWGMVEFGMPIDSEVLLGFASAAAGLTLATGMLFTWSVGLISPPSANRTLPSRVFTVFAWLVSGGLLFAWAFGASRIEPVAVWVMVSALLACLTLLIAINERDEWNVRIARTIPRFVLFRIPAFFLYTGAGGGILLAIAILGVTATITLTIAVSGMISGSFFTLSSPGYDPLASTMRTTSILVLYFYCYTLTAVLLRHSVLSKWVSREFTWVVALTLFIVLSVAPFLITFIVMQTRWDYHQHMFVLLLNPFVAVAEVAEGNHYYNRPEYALLFFSVSTGWAVLVTILNLPWLVQQMIRFHPPRQKKTKAAASPPELPAEVLTVEPLPLTAVPIPVVSDGASTSVQRISPTP